MIKAKAKADRAASRREAKDNSATATSTPQPTSTNGSTDPTETSTATESTSETPSREEQAETVQIPAKDQVLDRNELLRSKPEVVGRFMQLMVPVLIDVYAASVITSVRLKTLTGLLKAVGFLETEDLKRVFSVSAPHRLPNQIPAKYIPSSFRLPVFLLRFCRRRTILPSYWELFNSPRYCSLRYQRSTPLHSGEKVFSTRWKPWRTEYWSRSPRKMRRTTNPLRSRQ